MSEGGDPPVPGPRAPPRRPPGDREGPRGEAMALLEATGRLPDAEIDLFEVALALAALDRPDQPLGPYRAFLDTATRELEAQIGHGERLAGRRAAFLRRILVDGMAFDGARLDYDALENANLMHVIDRRRGLPVALGILWIALARRVGWGARGLNLPGHFVIAVEGQDGRAIVDPFGAGAAIDPAGLRRLLKQAVGPEAELQPAHQNPVGNRDTLLRLLNNIKLRRLKNEETAEAAVIVGRMLLIAPMEAPLWHEAGILHARLGNLAAAMASLRRLSDLAGPGDLRDEAQRLIETLRRRLN